MKKHLAIAVVALSRACILLSWGLLGQIHDQGPPQQQISIQSMSPRDLQKLRHDIQKQKQKLIAENLPMGESEAIKF